MKNIRPHHIISALAAGGIIVVALNFNSQPLFSSLDQFVLVAENKIHLAGDVQISSGDLASNKEIAIAGNNIVNGNLFADKIKIAGDTQINGDASFNELKLTQNSEILGTTSTPISLPIIELPDIPDFTPGNQDLIIQEDQVISPGDFNKLEVKGGVTLTLNPGTYNLNELALRDSARLLFSSTTVINIKKSFKINKKVLISQTTNIPSTDLVINVSSQGRAQRLTSSLADSSKNSRGKSSDRPSQGPPEEKPTRKPESKPTPQPRSAPQRGSAPKPPVIVQRPITIGENSLISFKLFAPNSKVHLGDRVTLRGQIIAREINVGEEGVLSKEITAAKIAAPEEIVTDPDGGVYPINILLVSLLPEASIADAAKVAESINGRIVGVVNSINLYQIEVSTKTIEDLETIIDNLRARVDLKIDGVFRDFLLPIGI